MGSRERSQGSGLAAVWGWRKESTAQISAAALLDHCHPDYRLTPTTLPSPPGCIDMLSIEGQFTFTAEQPQLHCAAFFIGEPEEVISIQYDLVNIDCQGGDFLKVRVWTLYPVHALGHP